MTIVNEFSRSVFVSQGENIETVIRTMLKDAMDLANNNRPSEYSITINIQLAAGNPEFGDLYGTQYIGVVEARGTIYKIKMKGEK